LICAWIYLSIYAGGDQTEFSDTKVENTKNIQSNGMKIEHVKVTNIGKQKLSLCIMELDEGDIYWSFIKEWH